MLQYGADTNLRSKGNKYSALHEAVAGGHIEVVSVLINHGANQLLVDDTGCTPLHLACMLDSIIIAGLLMKGFPGKKALQTPNKKGLKPIDVCKSQFLSSKVEGNEIFITLPWNTVVESKILDFNVYVCL